MMLKIWSIYDVLELLVELQRYYAGSTAVTTFRVLRKFSRACVCEREY